eukprot:5273387-Lingulodinium_polyedra.AAC.1
MSTKFLKKQHIPIALNVSEEPTNGSSRTTPHIPLKNVDFPRTFAPPRRTRPSAGSILVCLGHNGRRVTPEPRCSPRAGYLQCD